MARIYSRPRRADGDGWRVLVDRLWPRGLAKGAIDLDEWLRSVAPTTELRRWFHHDLSRFDEFADRYQEELRGKAAAVAVDHLVEMACEHARVTLLTATRDLQHSGAAVLGVVLAERVRRRVAQKPR